MRSLNKLFGMAAVLVGMSLVSSCSSDNTVGEPDPSVSTSTLSFVKAPEVRAWSGTQSFGKTRAGEEEEGEVVEDRTDWPEGFEPDTEGVYNKGHEKGRDEVEVNLAVNHKHDFVVNDEEGNPTTEVESVNDLVTKLSIHVRYGHDVKVRIPVPVEYVVPVDDMAIVLSHQYEDEIFKTEDSSVTYQIAGHDVTLHVQYYLPRLFDADFAEKDNEDYSKGYICVWTEGITDEVMAAVFDMYGDGLNFEVWNYYNKPDELDEEGQVLTTYPSISENELFHYVNRASVEFSIDQEGERVMPDAYINAFMKHESVDNGLEDGRRVDAFVYITGESALDGNWVDNHSSQRALFNDGYKTSYHLNGKAFNHIYKKNVEPVEEDDESEVTE